MVDLKKHQRTVDIIDKLVQRFKGRRFEDGCYFPTIGGVVCSIICIGHHDTKQQSSYAVVCLYNGDNNSVAREIRRVIRMYFEAIPLVVYCKKENDEYVNLIEMIRKGEDPRHNFTLPSRIEPPTKFKPIRWSSTEYL